MNLKDFLLCVVLIEHILKFLKIIIEAFILDTPQDVIIGRQERKQLTANYLEAKNTQQVDLVESEPDSEEDKQEEYVAAPEASFSVRNDNKTELQTEADKVDQEVYMSNAEEVKGELDIFEADKVDMSQVKSRPKSSRKPPRKVNQVMIEDMDDANLAAGLSKMDQLKEKLRLKKLAKGNKS